MQSRTYLYCALLVGDVAGRRFLSKNVEYRGIGAMETTPVRALSHYSNDSYGSNLA